MTEAELKRHLDAADKSPTEIAAAVSGPADKILRYKPRWKVVSTASSR
jgi:hypothetical protein